MAGFRSRCTTPSAWLAASASAIWAVSRAAATGREGAVLPQVAVQVGAVDEVHDQREQIALDDQVADADDVRVGQPQQHGALAQEAHHDVRVVRELLLEDLDRDGLAGLAGHGRLGARGLPLAGSPDGARGAASERLLEQVLAAYRPHVMRSLLHRASRAWSPSALCPGRSVVGHAWCRRTPPHRGLVPDLPVRSPRRVPERCGWSSEQFEGKDVADRRLGCRTRT